MNYDKMIYHILHKHNLGHRCEEFIDSGYVGIAKGLNKYDASKNAKKSTYLYNCIKNEIFNELKKEKCIKRQAEIITLENKHLENLSDDINLEENIIDQEEKNELYSNLFKLPIYEQYVIYQKYIKGRTKKEIAIRLDMSITQVNKLHKNGIEQLKGLYKV